MFGDHDGSGNQLLTVFQTSSVEVTKQCFDPAAARGRRPLPPPKVDRNDEFVTVPCILIIIKFLATSVVTHDQADHQSMEHARLVD